MTMLQLFRLWARRAPAGERAGAVAGIAAAVAVIIWLADPGAATGPTGVQGAMSPTGQSAVSPGAAPLTSTGSGGAAGSGSGAGATLPAAGSAAAGAGAARAGAANSGAASSTGAGRPGSGSAGTACVAPAGSDQGITAGTIKVAVLVLNIAGAVGNSTYSVPPPAQQEADYQTAIDAVNKSGGVACRKVVAQFFQANPVDSGSLQQLCLDVAQARPFFVFSGSAYIVYQSLMNCYAQNHLPFYATFNSTAQQNAAWYPYGFTQYQSDMDYHSAIFALASRGWFSAANGFKKLGVAYQDCDADIPTEFMSWLHQAGVQASQIDAYDLGCSGLFTPPSTLEQAIIKFKSDGVTNVTFAYDERDWANWTKISEQQHYRPKYAFSDETQIAVTYSQNAPDLNNINNAIAITNTAIGEEHTPGMQPTAVTQQCLAAYKTKVSYPMTSYASMIEYSEKAGDCGALWQFRAMVEQAPYLQRAALAAGLQAAGSIALPYAAPVDWNAPRRTWNGEYWRVNEFFADCKCWRLIDKKWHPPM